MAVLFVCCVLTINACISGMSTWIVHISPESHWYSSSDVTQKQEANIGVLPIYKSVLKGYFSTHKGKLPLCISDILLKRGNRFIRPSNLWFMITEKGKDGCCQSRYMHFSQCMHLRVKSKSWNCYNLSQNFFKLRVMLLGCDMLNGNVC